MPAGSAPKLVPESGVCVYISSKPNIYYESPATRAEGRGELCTLPLCWMIYQKRRMNMDWYLMVWRKYAEFDGRSRRTEFWMFELFNFMAAFVLIALGCVGLAISGITGASCLFRL